MQLVFKISAGLLCLAAVGGQIIQQQRAAPGSAAKAVECRASCPEMGGPATIKTVGQEVRFYDAYVIRLITGSVGLTSGCRRPASHGVRLNGSLDAVAGRA